MSDAEIRELTASEPLALEEEYDMQSKLNVAMFQIVQRSDSFIII